MIKKEVLTGGFNNILPATFQDSETYYEQLLLIREKLNELIYAYNSGEGGGGSGGYILPIATADKLGGVKVGNNLNITEDGVLNAEATSTPYELPIASTTTLGGVKDSRDEGVSIAGDGTIFLKAIPDNFELKPREGGIYGNWLWLKPATANTLGGVKIGEGIDISEDGIISVNIPEIPTITIELGQGLKMVDGKITLDLGAGLYFTEDGKVNANIPDPEVITTGIQDSVNTEKTGSSSSSTTESLNITDSVNYEIY